MIEGCLQSHQDSETGGRPFSNKPAPIEGDVMILGGLGMYVAISSGMHVAISSGMTVAISFGMYVAISSHSG